MAGIVHDMFIAHLFPYLIKGYFPFYSALCQLKDSVSPTPLQLGSSV